MYIKLGGVAAYIVWIDFCLMSVPGVCEKCACVGINNWVMSSKFH